MPAYIVLEECKRERIRVEAGRRAAKYERKTRAGGNPLVLDCIQDLDTSTKGKKARWVEEREKYYNRCGYGLERVRARTDEKIEESLARADADNQRQLQNNRIERSRYNPRFKHKRCPALPWYLHQGKSLKEIKSWAKERCEGSKFWEEA